MVAMAAGRIRLCSEQARAYTRDLMSQRPLYRLEWEAWLRELDRYEPDYTL
jgi:hypothetical protein